MRDDDNGKIICKWEDHWNKSWEFMGNTVSASIPFHGNPTTMDYSKSENGLMVVLSSGIQSPMKRPWIMTG